MKMRKLGQTDLMVSELCLGTMTFGTQTPEADAHTQLEVALDGGINFLDAAEMYPVNPIRKETIGRTENREAKTRGQFPPWLSPKRGARLSSYRRRPAACR